MEYKDFISYRQLSILLTGGDNSIRRNKIPIVHAADVEALEQAVKKWFNERSQEPAPMASKTIIIEPVKAVEVKQPTQDKVTAEDKKLKYRAIATSLYKAEGKEVYKVQKWTAIEEAEKLCREKTGDPEAGFNASTFWLGGDGRHLLIPMQYRGKKGKKGQEEFTQSYKNMNIYAKFCPFTGKPLYEVVAEYTEKEKP